MFCKITLFRCYHHFFHIHYTRKNRFLASAKYRFLCLIYLIHDIVFHSALRNPKCYGKLRIQVAFCHPQITLVSRRDLLSLLQAGHLPLIKGLNDPHPFCTFAAFHAFLVLFLSLLLASDPESFDLWNLTDQFFCFFFGNDSSHDNFFIVYRCKYFSTLFTYRSQNIIQLSLIHI